MIITAIAAMSRTGVIGDGVKMPWHLPRDLKRFRQATMGKPIIMGRRTLESLPGPLPGRLNIALTRSAAYRAEGFRIALSLDEALQIAEEQGGETPEVMIIGGGVVYRESASLWDRLLLTVVDGDFLGNTVFPLTALNAHRWRLIDEQFSPPDGKNPHADWFLNLERLQEGETDHLQPPGFDLPAWLSRRANLPVATGEKSG